MWGSLAVKVARIGLKTTQKISTMDVSNPLTQDTIEFFLSIAKEIIKPF